MSLRIDPSQRFSCSQCGRCCRGFDVVVTAAEIDHYRRRNAASWIDEGNGAAARDPFEPVPGAATLQRIRKRDDGACVFLSAGNRCRIHEELGGSKKPLTCRLFPYAFHNAADGVVVSASFNCPTIVANEGTLISDGASKDGLESLRKEWIAIHPASKPAALELVAGRTMTTRSLLVLRQSLLVMLGRDANDLRAGIRRIAAVLDDLTRSRVLGLADDDFAEYLQLTAPHAASKGDAPAPRGSGAIAGMLQYGFLYAVAATRHDIAHPRQSRTTSRLRRLQLLAHFHGLAPQLDGLNVKALKRRHVDINDEPIRPIAFHFLRATIETLGAAGRPIVDELSMACSKLNAACSIAAMQADALNQAVDRAIFIDAVTAASDVSHARSELLKWVLRRFSGGTDGVWGLAEV